MSNEQTSTAAPRTIVVAITALDAGIVVVTPVDGEPRVFQGDAAKQLHALARDESIATGTLEKANAGGFAGRLLGIAEKLVTDGG